MANKNTHSGPNKEASKAEWGAEKMPSEAQQEGPTGPHFQLKTLYIKDFSFESPHAPEIFTKEWEQPKMVFDVNIGTEKCADDHYEVVLHITLKANSQDDKPIYLLELQQAGVFQLVGFTEDIMKRVVSTTCPEILFPYVRETVSSMVARGGFPQMILPPMNFNAMYAQYLAKGESPKAANSDSDSEDIVTH
jgi:preprotein translocase subunit SecB